MSTKRTTKAATATAPAPTDRMERRPLSALTAYARNSRTHSEEQIGQLMRSFGEWGQTMPVLVQPDGTIVAGHARVEAMRRLGYEDCACVVATGWTPAQVRAYVIADNQLALSAGWDPKVLRSEMLELQGMEFDLDLTGFAGDDLVALMAEPANEGLGDADEVPEPPENPRTRLGDVWVMGQHRIICGDSTCADTVAALLGDVKPHLMVTDPPYGVEYDPGWREKAGVAGGDYAKGKVLNDDRADWREAWALFPGDVAYVWHAGLFAGVVGESLIATKFKLRSQIIWDKGQLVLSRGDYHWQHESCWYAVREGKTGHWAGGRKQVTVRNVAKPRKSETGHGTQKPIECMRRPIENNSKPGDEVYEPFCGSGTTIIAGEMTGRPVYAIEINPAYVDLAVQRWQSFTGQSARRESDGSAFDDLTTG